MIKIEIKSGKEVVETITKVLHKKGITEGSIVSIIGAVDECAISTMPKDDAKKDILTEYQEPLEMSGMGEIVDGKPHIHATLGREGNTAIFGHLRWAKVKHWFVHVYIRPLD